MGKAGDGRSFKLNTGAYMPAVSLGVSAIRESKEETRAYVKKAIEVGYRALDTAKLYGSEAAVGEGLRDAINEGIVKREDVFVTTKIWRDDMHPPDILPAVQRGLSEMKLDYADSILIHYPLRARKGTPLMQLKNEDILPLDLVGCWKALEQAVDLGLAKSIGVSNFSSMRIKEIEPHAKYLPAVNQMEMHPGCEQTKLREYCKEKGILVTAWSPLGAPGYGFFGTASLIDSPVVKEIAEKHGKSSGQVLLRWGLDKGVGVTVKSSNPERMAQNLDIFGWTLSPEDHETLGKLPKLRISDGSKVFEFPNSPYKCLADVWDDDV